MATQTDGHARDDGYRESMDETVDNARDMAHEARRQVDETARQQRDAAAEQASGLANALRRTGEELDQQEQSWLRDAAYRVARDADRLAANMHNRDMRAWINDGQKLARRNPVLFVGGAVATGFLLTRFLNSSSQREDGGVRPAPPARVDVGVTGNGASPEAPGSEVRNHASAE